MKKYTKIMTALLIGGSATVAGLAGIGYQKALNKADAAVDTNSFRFWLAADLNNSFKRNRQKPKLWFHTGSGNSDADKGEDVLVAEPTGEWDNNQEKGYGNTVARTYYYFDIGGYLLDAYYMTIQCFRMDDGVFMAQYDAALMQLTQFGKVCYAWGDYKNISYGEIESVDAGLAAKGLEGLLTCSPNAINGYKGFPAIESTFVKHGSAWKTVGNLSDHEIDDYASAQDYNDASKKTVKVNAYAKYLALQSQYEAHK